MTRLEGRNPDAVYFGGNLEAGDKVAREIAQMFPAVLKLTGDGLMSGAFISAVGPASEGRYASIAAPNSIASPEVQDWVFRYKGRFGREPESYTLLAYYATLVVADALSRLARDGQETTRENVRAYLQTTDLLTLQGRISFDENGDLNEKIISMFQVQNGTFNYLGTAPQN